MVKIPNCAYTDTRYVFSCTKPIVKTYHILYIYIILKHV